MFYAIYKNLKRSSLILTMTVMSIFSAIPSLAQDKWPSRSITMIVPFPPGGVADTVARPVAEAMSRQLGQPVIIENKAGAGGGVGMAFASKAKPDGYTILMTLSSISIIPEADKILGKEMSYQINQFKPIARFTADPTVLVVRADSPWTTYDQFLAECHPDIIKIGLSFFEAEKLIADVVKTDIRLDFCITPKNCYRF